eukprot:SAG22_NODE_5613_length_985_cov_0.860045_1_plen_87_part_00
MAYVPSGYTSTLPEWCAELTVAQRAVLEPPYVYHRPLVTDDGTGVLSPRREGEETAVLSARSGEHGMVMDDKNDRVQGDERTTATR